MMFPICQTTRCHTLEYCTLEIHGRDNLKTVQDDLEVVLMAYTREMLGSYLGRDISYPD
jgi:hypothetical protein